MANLTDPLIRAVQGTDPQNLMEYITRQKIYDSRFWKEECFGLTAVDVMERAAKSLKCIGGSFGGYLRPTKFLCFTLKLLQLQPDLELVQEFLQQDHFKYVKALGAFYLRLTGRPADIYEGLEPLYSDYSKLKYRDVNEWKLVHMDEFIDELMTKPFACSIALPRLPFRETLQDAGYVEEGPRPTALKQKLENAGGIEEYLKHKVEVERSPAATALWEKGKGVKSKDKTKLIGKNNQRDSNISGNHSDANNSIRQDVEEGGEKEEGEEIEDRKQTTEEANDEDTKKRKSSEDNEEKKKKKKPKYGSLFKKDKRKDTKSSPDQTASKLEEGSEEYWNEQRAKLGLKPLK